MTDRSDSTKKTRGEKIIERLHAALRKRLDALLENNRQLRRKIESLQSVVDAGRHLTEAADLEELIEKALSTIIELGEVRGAAISVIETYDSERLTLTRHQGLGEVDPDDLVFKTDSPLVTAARDTDDVLWVADLVGKAGPRSKQRALLRRLGCELIVPLTLRGRILGLMLLTSRNDDTTSDPDSVKLLASYAASLSLVMENLFILSEHPQARV